MTRIRAFAFALVAALCGCSNLAPYPTPPPALPPGKTAAGTRVAICTDGFSGSRAAVRARAQRECPAHTVASYLATDLRLNHCPLLLPARATFRCIPGK
ncbi:MAG: hypothetical protein ACREFK_17020 [Stellaceae bacterium]